MKEAFIRQRITELMLKKGISQSKMSLDLGHSENYIHNITSGKSMPSVSNLIAICDYLGITPSQFFDNGYKNPALIQNILTELKGLDDNDLVFILLALDRIKK